MRSLTFRPNLSPALCISGLQIDDDGRLPLWYVFLAVCVLPSTRVASTVFLYYSRSPVHVFIKIKPGNEEAFREASLKNARESAKEPGIARFDVLQDKDDTSSFVLVEVYKDGEAPAKHKETAHYLEWRDTVADMMAEPRQARKFVNHFPRTSPGWDYPLNKPLE